MKKCYPTVLSFSLLCVLAGGFTAAQEAPKPGELLPMVKCAAAPEQSYALYLPPGYTPARRWPVVYAFDPGARGSVPVERMKIAAERYGFILAASNNSKNGPWKPQVEAAGAVWLDTHARLAIDDSRVLFAGFSGGARLAALLAQQCRCAQGVLLNGAGFSQDAPPSRDSVFPVFAAVGLDDVSYAEMVELDAKLDALSFPHYLRRFDGSHQWMPPEVAEEAFAWFVLLAMKENRLARDNTLISREFERASARAASLEQSGEFYFAWQHYLQTAAVMAGLADTTLFEKRAAQLGITPSVRKARQWEKEDIEKQQAWLNRILSLALSPPGPRLGPEVPELSATELVREVRESAVKEKNSRASRVLRRVQTGVFLLSIETGESAMEKKDYATAKRFLELAVEARPDWPWSHFSLAQCLARSGDKKGAVKSLKRALETGLNAARLRGLLEEFPEFAPLAADPEIQKLLADAPAAAPARP